jgi:hypothetical protein
MSNENCEQILSGIDSSARRDPVPSGELRSVVLGRRTQAVNNHFLCLLI